MQTNAIDLQPEIKSTRREVHDRVFMRFGRGDRVGVILPRDVANVVSRELCWFAVREANSVAEIHGEKRQRFVFELREQFIHCQPQADIEIALCDARIKNTLSKLCRLFLDSLDKSIGRSPVLFSFRPIDRTLEEEAHRTSLKVTLGVTDPLLESRYLSLDVLWVEEPSCEFAPHHVLEE